MSSASRSRLTSTLRSRKAPRPPGPWRITEVDAFLSIDARGLVTCYSGKVDLGTGITTALRQMVADELDVPMNQVNLITGDTMLTPDQGKTWGSLTIQLGGMQIRNAAATARAALLEEAAKRLNAKPEDLKVADGVINGGGKQVSLWRARRRQDVLAQARPRQARQGQGPEGLQVRRQTGAARGYSRTK